jgi:hypothetical protein
MDDPPGGQGEAGCGLRIARIATPEGGAGGAQFGCASGAMDSSIDTTPARQLRIGGVDDGVNALQRYVAPGDLDPHLLQPLAGWSEEIEDFPLRGGRPRMKITRV